MGDDSVNAGVTGTFCLPEQGMRGLVGESHELLHFHAVDRLVELEHRRRLLDEGLAFGTALEVEQEEAPSPAGRKECFRLGGIPGEKSSERDALKLRAWNVLGEGRVFIEDSFGGHCARRTEGKAWIFARLFENSFTSDRDLDKL